MKIQNVLCGIIFVFLIVIMALLFRIQSTLDTIAKWTPVSDQSMQVIQSIQASILNIKSTIDYYQKDIAQIRSYMITIKPKIDYIELLCGGIPLLMSPK